jgi:hypothetical protein
MMYAYVWGDEYLTGKTMVEVSVGECTDKGCMCRVGNLYESDDAADYRREALEFQVMGGPGKHNSTFNVYPPVGYVDDGNGYYRYVGNVPGDPGTPGKIREERGADYGSVECNHSSIGYIWGGLLMQAVESKRWKAGDPIPAELVTLMMVGVKLSREAFKHKNDNIVDGKNYLDFTGELSE